MERKLKEQDRKRQMLAKVESNFQPFPKDSCAPAAPPRAHRGLELPGEPLGHEAPQAGEGSHHERFDSAHGSQVWIPTTRTQVVGICICIYVLLSYSNFDIFLFSLATAI